MKQGFAEVCPHMHIYKLLKAQTIIRSLDNCWQGRPTLFVSQETAEVERECGATYTPEVTK